MNGDSVTSPFFNRRHFAQGAQLLALVFCMLGVVFAGLDWRELDLIRPTTYLWLGAGVVLSVATVLVSRRVLAGVASIALGAAMGILYLVVTVVLSRTIG